MDALPIQEENEVPYKSVNNGVMHACGHDGHMAMLLVAAKIFSDYREKIKGNIKFVFQPDEEVAGAKFMIEEGILENPHVNAAMGLHLWTQMESGEIGVVSGLVTATLEAFNLKIKGKGGHTANPEKSIDPVICAANIIQAVQIIQTREIEALKSTVIMFGKIKGGTKSNIIPDEVSLEGTIRYSYEDEGELAKKFERIVKAICKAYRAEYELNFNIEDRAVINDPDMAKLVKSTAGEVLNNNNKIKPLTWFCGEDFSEFALRVPSVFYFIGAGNKEKKSDYSHHHPRFNIDEDVMSIGVEMHVKCALKYLNSIID